MPALPIRMRGMAVLCAALLAGTALLQGSEIPFLASRVNDTAGILSPPTAAELEKRLKAHEDSTSNQIAVLTIPGLEGESIESYSIRVVDNWKLGQKGKDNGVLLLVARDDHKVRIEVGRGLEGNLPDITCGIIIRKEIVPRFKEGDYDAGVRAGIEAILAAIDGAYTADATDAGDDILMKIVAFAIFLGVVGVFTMIALFTKGFQSWFLYAFLIPFWLAFPVALLGTAAGLLLFSLYAVGFVIFKLWVARSGAGQHFFQQVATASGFGSTSGGLFSGSGSSSGGFSGGGGGFSGGGASGSW
jgi:uncharacterized protein